MEYLSADNFPNTSEEERRLLDESLQRILTAEYHGNMFALMRSYQRILGDNHKRGQWAEIHNKLLTLFQSGRAVPLDGPMIGSTVSIRDSDYFRDTVKLFGANRSAISNIEWMATAWNLTFSDTGLWMGKTFESTTKQLVADKTREDPQATAAYDPASTRIGRNYFREPPHPNLIQSLGLPALTEMWKLRDRPSLLSPEIFNAQLSPDHAEKEKYVPYTKTGGLFLADMGASVVPEMRGKRVYQLNYRWPMLLPAYPMTRLVDEIVQIGEGIYLGQLVFATRNYAYMSFGTEEGAVQLGTDYVPHAKPGFFARLFSLGDEQTVDYGYQNNGFFLMMDPDYATQIYAEDAFLPLRPREGESGYVELGYDQVVDAPTQTTEVASGDITDWGSGWKSKPELAEKFTTLILEPSPKDTDSADVRTLMQEGESVLQMLKRISDEISEKTRHDDNLDHFEKLAWLFRCGVAPKVENGLFRRYRAGAYNARIAGAEKRQWYGQEEPLTGVDYYHGANLNLHCGFQQSLRNSAINDQHLFPSILADHLADERALGPNILNELWQSIGKYIFPWAGKSFEKISGRKLSMLLDESDDLASRYPQRTHELETHLASAPHYLALLKNQEHFWQKPPQFASQLNSGPWDKGMTDEQKAFWEEEADQRWVFGNNLQDERVLSADIMLRLADMNYGDLDPAVQASADNCPSPFVRQGYVFLGVADQNSILPMNNGEGKNKKVFQFQYRYPMIGGPAPIGYCLDELVEIADGLFLGQLIYATKLDLPFSSSLDPSEYQYQLFGFFLLLDDDWQRHRLAIGLDVWQ